MSVQYCQLLSLQHYLSGSIDSYSPVNLEFNHFAAMPDAPFRWCKIAGESHYWFAKTKRPLPIETNRTLKHLNLYNRA